MAAATKRNERETALCVEDVQVRLRTSPEPKKARGGERTYRWDVAHGQMLLLSPSMSPPVVVSVSVPTSDGVRVRV